MPTNPESLRKAGWSLIAHGGAKDIAPEDEQANREGMIKAIAIGAEILSGGGSAIDAVEAVVKELELNPAYNAGLYGSVLNADGGMELDASIMDGATLNIGAIAGLVDVQHPVSVARALLTDRTIFLAGPGANQFATREGFKINDAVASPAKSSKGGDTVGCVALDAHGSLAAATSTGGLGGKRMGRVGDVPLPGCGFYADNKRGAASASGDGEYIARTLLVSQYLHLLEQTDPQTAANQALASVAELGGEAGIIAITPYSDIIWAHNSPHFAVGIVSDVQPIPQAFLKKDKIHAA